MTGEELATEQISIELDNVPWPELPEELLAEVEMTGESRGGEATPIRSLKEKSIGRTGGGIPMASSLIRTL